PGCTPGDAAGAGTGLLRRNWKASHDAVLEKQPECRRAVVTAAERAPLAVLAECAALRGHRLVLNVVRIDVGIGSGLDRHEGGDAFAASDGRVITLDHDPIAAGRGEGRAQNRPALVIFLRQSAWCREGKAGGD